MQTGVLAEFPTAEAMLRAVDLLQDHGYRRLETYTPFPVAGLAQRRRLPRPWLAKLVFAGGLLGAILGYAIQWYANAYDYPLNVGGRPVHSAPAFIPATFEAAVLGAALTAFVGLFWVIGLPALWHPVFEVDGFERASVDRYWVAVEGDSRRLDLGSIRRVLAPLEPLRVLPLEDDQ